MPHKITPVILAGGRGLRLRPLTSQARPKPFLKPLSTRTLLQTTLERCKPFGDPVITANAAWLGSIREQAQNIAIRPRAILCEPVHRSTAPAVLLAAFYLQDQGTCMLVMPSDAYIKDESVFHRAVEQASLACDDAIALLAVRPSELSRRFGYMQICASADLDVPHVLKNFIEKPSAQKLREMRKVGNFLCNTGIFMCYPKFFLDTAQREAPALYETVKAAYMHKTQEGEAVFPDKTMYEQCDETSIDRAIMERISGGKVVPLNTEWHDIGCWSSLLRVKMKTLFV